ncbi:Bud-site selection protein [Lasiosphaeria miniovina]|uniref:Bud-site selection protein n=1 Tax=Lasiosphaeria miniovina TaxID=1954250 RepID=A0AA40DQK7_9PEZI|nr:Bud-site selection protein [Lasiosphaeria miniovina]KAK0709821.1 Bud-site selection protein [Lasiosphaeria miniovina]
MPKRKRSDEEESVEEVFGKFRTELNHALKKAKGFERQRQSKRLYDAKATPDKKRRVENEILVLKSLNLHQTAHAHFCSALLRIRAAAESPKLPAEIKAGVAKPNLTEEEQTTLHNVTSALYSHSDVRAVIDRAITQICKALNVPVPEKKGKGGKKLAAAPVAATPAAKEGLPAEKAKKGKKKSKDSVPENADQAGQKEAGREVDDDDDEATEMVISQLDNLLGASSSERDSNTDEEDTTRALIKGARLRRLATRDLDPMEITSSEEEESEDEVNDDLDLDPMEVTSDEGGEEDDSSSDEIEFKGFSPLDIEDEASHGDDESNSSSEGEDDDDDDDEEEDEDPIPRPPPAKKKKKETATATDSTFLPSLMAGYISGSESASDIDVEPRKNRRGQRARQQIWEKKFKAEAKHLKKMARDDGWDSKRGAVEAGEDGKPWKRGIRNPLLGRGGRGGADKAPPLPPPKPKTRDDTGPLHPSWEAKKKLKLLQKDTAPYQGKKITFD